MTCFISEPRRYVPNPSGYPPLRSGWGEYNPYPSLFPCLSMPSSHTPNTSPYSAPLEQIRAQAKANTNERPRTGDNPLHDNTNRRPGYERHASRNSASWSTSRPCWPANQHCADSYANHCTVQTPRTSSLRLPAWHLPPREAPNPTTMKAKA